MKSQGLPVWLSRDFLAPQSVLRPVQYSGFLNTAETPTSTADHSKLNTEQRLLVRWVIAIFFDQQKGTMMTLTLYTNPQSRGQIIRWMLEEVGAPYDTVLLDYGTTMKPPEYLAINPMGKVPAIKHGGAVVTEQVFSIPGLGKLIVNGASNRDYTLVLGLVILVTVVAVLLNLLVDLAYAYLDPKIRY